MAGEIRGVRWLLMSLALQNLGRRKARSLLLIAAVAIGSAVVFTGATLMQSIDRSMAMGFTRMGADMMVVPEGALTNITAALLVVEPTDLVLDADAFANAGLASVGRVAPQKIVRVEHSGIGSHHDSVDLIGFDPARDFTIQPWLAERINRGLQAGDVILGAERDAPLGSQLLIFGKPHIVYGRLGRTGVGTHERGVFMAFATLEALAGVIHGPMSGGGGAPPAALAPGKVTGFLVELAPGATALQARFAILSSLKGVKVVAGDTTMSGIRQGLAALLDGMLVTEAVLATGVGGLVGVVLGVLMMRLFERSLVYYLEKVGVPFIWVDTPRTIAFAAGAIVLASIIGALGVLYPAWRASRRDAYDLVRSEGWAEA